MIDLMDLHTHTLACGHAYNTLYEMARSASEKGVPLFGSSDHAPAMPGSCHKYYFTNLSPASTSSALTGALPLIIPGLMWGPLKTR